MKWQTTQTETERASERKQKRKMGGAWFVPTSILLFWMTVRKNVRIVVFFGLTLFIRLFYSCSCCGPISLLLMCPFCIVRCLYFRRCVTFHRFQPTNTRAASTDPWSGVRAYADMLLFIVRLHSQFSGSRAAADCLINASFSVVTSVSSDKPTCSDRIFLVDVWPLCRSVDIQSNVFLRWFSFSPSKSSKHFSSVVHLNIFIFLSEQFWFILHKKTKNMKVYWVKLLNWIVEYHQVKSNISKKFFVKQSVFVLYFWVNSIFAPFEYKTNDANIMDWTLLMAFERRIS